MVTVALVGADGAGKTTIGRRLPDSLGIPARYVYLGANPAAATHALPTTRLVHRWRSARGRAAAGGPPPLRPVRRGPATPATRLRRSTRAAGRTTHQLAEALYQAAVVRWHERRGRVVVVDRLYAADHHAHDRPDDSGLPWSRRIRAAVQGRLLDRPDLVVVLDAPPPVLHARKGEGTLAELERRRQEYLDFVAERPDGWVIDAARPLPEVEEDVLAAVRATIRSAEGARA